MRVFLAYLDSTDRSTEAHNRIRLMRKRWSEMIATLRSSKSGEGNFSFVLKKTSIFLKARYKFMCEALVDIGVPSNTTPWFERREYSLTKYEEYFECQFSPTPKGDEA